MELTTQQLGILDVCTNRLGYKIHTGLDKTITIYKWLTKRSDLVVPYSVFWVAAGALLIHENKVLLVQEKGVKINLFRARGKATTGCLEGGPIEES